MRQAWLAGRANQEAHAEEDVSQPAQGEPARSGQTQGSTLGRRGSQQKQSGAPALNGSSADHSKPEASAAAQPQKAASKLQS